MRVWAKQNTVMMAVKTEHNVMMGHAVMTPHGRVPCVRVCVCVCACGCVRACVCVCVCVCVCT
jgi:hypothetical protein